jgi:hypothetical protein
MSSPPRRANLKQAGAHIAGVLGYDDCALAGGAAVSVHGYVRATKDVDLITRLPLAEALSRLKAAGIEAELRVASALDGDFSCIKGNWRGVRYDVLPQLVPIDWERAPAVIIGKSRTLRVVPLDTLLALKLRAGGPQDLLDAAMLILTHPKQRERALGLAEAYRVREQLEMWLSAPRVLQSHRDLSARERSRRTRSEPSQRPRRPTRRRS